jgi:hypothetical protein
MSESTEYYGRLAQLAERIKKPLNDLDNLHWKIAEIARDIVVTLEIEFHGVDRDQVYGDLEDILPWSKRKIANAVQMVEFLQNNGLERICLEATLPFHVARMLHRSGLAPATKNRTIRLVEHWYEKGNRKANTASVRLHLTELKDAQGKKTARSDQKVKQLECTRRACAYFLRKYRGRSDSVFDKIVVPALERYLEATKHGAV